MVFKIAVFLAVLAAASANDEIVRQKGSIFREKLMNVRNRINDTAFAIEILTIHNNLRRQHGAPDLTLSDALSEQAKEEAGKKASQWALNGKFDSQNDPDRSYNDNVWATLSVSTTRIRPEKVMGAWLAEEKKHNYSVNYFQEKTGHFSQIIWRSTDEIGVGWAWNRTIINVDEGGDTDKKLIAQLKAKRKYIYIVVVRYTPPGNILDTDAFSENVSPPGAQ